MDWNGRVSPLEDVPTELPERLRRTLVRRDVETFLDLISPSLFAASAASTRQNVLSSLRRYLRWCLEEQRGVLSASAGDARAYRDHLVGRHSATPATVHNHLVRVRKLYAALIRKGVHAGPNPFAGLEAPTHHPERHRDVFAWDELRLLLEHADAAGRALLLLGAHGGLSGAEVAGLRWEEVFLRHGELLLPGRLVKMTGTLHGALRAHGRLRGHTDLFSAGGKVFDLENAHAVRGALYGLCRQAGVAYRPWRALRHLAALRRLERGESTKEVARFMGLGARRTIDFTNKVAGG